jgi:hypothetical protein
MCTDMSQNDTITQCPINNFKDKQEFIVAVHNQQPK